MLDHVAADELAGNADVQVVVPAGQEAPGADPRVNDLRWQLVLEGREEAVPRGVVHPDSCFRPTDPPVWITRRGPSAPASV